MSLTSIDLGLEDVFRDQDRRHDFFKAIVQDEIASQIRELRLVRGLNQNELAAKTEMQQSAISRIEQAEYSGWTFKTLMRIAGALDARWRMQLEPCEVAVREYLNAVEDDPEEKFGDGAYSFSQIGRSHQSFEPAYDQ